MAKRILESAILLTLKSLCPIRSLKIRPANTIGMVAIINCNAKLLFFFIEASFVNIALSINKISVLKKYITATKVPACTAISKGKPKSFDPNNKDGKSKCAELDIGKNSVNP